MRIVHEIYGKPQCAGDTKPYIPRSGKQGYSGSRIELVCVSPGVAGPTEVIEIEGDIDDVRRALEGMLEILELCDELDRERLGPLRDTPCPDACVALDLANAMHRADCPMHPNFEEIRNNAVMQQKWTVIPDGDGA